MSVETEAAWAAGFFDGEGSVFVSHRKEYIRKTGKKQCAAIIPCVSIHQVHTEPLERFRDVVSVGYVNGPYKATGLGTKPVYQFGVQGRESFCDIAEALWPYLSTPKKEQFRKVHAEVKSAMKEKLENLRELPN